MSLSNYKYMKREETIDFNIKAAWHAISRLYNVEANLNDMTTSIGFILLNIDSEKGESATKIAPLLGLEARSITRTLKNMEEKGLIYKQKATKDKRGIRVFLTDLGKEKKEISRKTVLNFNFQMQEMIDKDELKTFFSVIQQINKIIDEKKVVF